MPLCVWGYAVMHPYTHSVRDVLHLSSRRPLRGVWLQGGIRRMVSATAPHTLMDPSRGVPVQTCIPIQEQFHVLLKSWPRSVSMKIYEIVRKPWPRGLTSKALLAEIPIAIPGAPGTPPAATVPTGYDWACPTLSSVPPMWEWDDADLPDNLIPVDVPGQTPQAEQAVYPQGTQATRQALWNILLCYCWTRGSCAVCCGLTQRTRDRERPCKGGRRRRGAEQGTMRAGRLLVRCSWAPLPACTLPGSAGRATQPTMRPNPAFASSRTNNPVFEASENVADAIAVEMPLAPPHPEERCGSGARRRAGHQRLQFAQVRCGARAKVVAAVVAPSCQDGGSSMFIGDRLRQSGTGCTGVVTTW